MKPRVLTTLFVAGLIAVAGPAWSQSRGGHGGGGHVSGGGHFGSGGHVGFGGHGSGVVRHVPTGHLGGGLRGGVPRWGGGGHGWRGHTGWRGSYGFRGSYGWGGWYGWPSLYLDFPFWWDGGWTWPYYGGWGYGSIGAYDAGTVFVPSDEPVASSGSGGAAATGAPTAVDAEVTPKEALVYLNGVLIGSVADFDGATGFLDLDAGRYTLEFRAAGYRTRSVDLNVRGESKAVVALDLQRDPTSPAGALNPPSPGVPYGREFGPTFGPATSQALRRDRAPGAAAPGRETAALKLQVSPANAAVYVDGVLVGTGEELARLQRGVAVSPGTHRVDVVAPGHPGKSVQVDVDAGQAQKLTLELD